MNTRAPITPLIFAAIAVFIALAPPGRTAIAAPAIRSDPAFVIHLPLVMNTAARADFAPGVPISPSPTMPGATTSPGATTTPTTPTLEPTLEPTPDPTATSPPPPIEIEGDWVRTPHYALLSPSPAVDKLDLGRMMEQFYDQATAYFGAEPDLADTERLVGKIYADAAAYRAGLIADGIFGDPGGSGGYYDPGGGVFYLFIQPSRHFTRMLTLHEATHQLQHRAGGCRSPGWWTEGEAELLGMHTWDGETLHIARQPLISLEDYPERALEAFRAKGGDVGYLTRGEGGWSYREAWALAAFAHDAYPAEAGRLRARYCAGDDAATGWAEAFGGPFTPALTAEYEAWLMANQEPWEWIYNEFEPHGERAFRGRSDVNAIAVTKVRPMELTVELEPVSGSLRAGILVGYHDPSDFVMLRLYADRRLEVIRVSPGWSWSWLLVTTAPTPAPGLMDRMSAAVVDGAIEITMNGERVITLDGARDVEGRFGLNLEGCEVVMRLIEMEERGAGGPFIELEERGAGRP